MVQKFNFSLSNDTSVVLSQASKTYAKGDEEYPYSKALEFFPEQAKLCNLLAHALTGDSIEGSEELVLKIATSEGAFKAVYGPSVCYDSDTDKVSIFLAGRLIPVQTTGMTGEVETKEGFNCVATFVNTKYNGYDDLCLRVMLAKGKDVLVSYTLPVRFGDLSKLVDPTGEKKGKAALDVDSFNMNLFEESHAYFANFLNGKPGSGTIYKQNLLQPDTYDVVGYELTTTKTGRPCCTLELKGKVNDIGEISQAWIDPNDESRTNLIPFEGGRFWTANSVQLNTLKNEKPTFSADSPGQLRVRSVKPGNKKDTYKVDSVLQFESTGVADVPLEGLSVLDF